MSNQKEASARLKINKLLEQAGWRFFDDFTTTTKFVDFPFKVKSSAMKILGAKENVNISYIFYMMQKVNFDASQHKRY